LSHIFVVIGFTM